MAKSLFEVLSELPEEERKELLGTLSEQEAEQLQYLWKFWARPEQLEPGTPGAAIQRTDWTTWLVLAGRGYGKTKTGAEFVRSNVCGSTPLTGGGYGRVALVGETASDARHVMVEGGSGILAVHPKDHRPEYSPANRKLTWPNGAVAYHYNATEPDQLRGPEHDLSWEDELAKWDKISTDDSEENTHNMLMFGLRLGERPKGIITTTPRPVQLIRDLIASPNTVFTRRSTFDNVANLAPTFVAQIRDKFGNTRLGRQELEAEILDDAPGALWNRANIDDYRVTEETCPEIKRLLVGVDPAISIGSENVAETGIVTAGLGVNGHAYVFDDLSGQYSPDGWARKAVSGIDARDGDGIVAEINQGGDMVERTLRSARATVNVIKVRATRGKGVRAEPIAALYEQGRVHHVGMHPKLEDQMMTFTPEGPIGGGRADRVDALVWVLTALFDKIVKSHKSQKKHIFQGHNDYDPLRY